MGLAKIGQSTVSTLSPPKSETEKTVARSYAQWRDSELMKKRWVFATQIRSLARTDRPKIDGVREGYEFQKPGDVLRIVREKRSLWLIRGNKVYSPYDIETVECICRVDEELFDPLFVEVLACRVAKEMVEPVTQSNEKWEKAQALYEKAILDAGKLNAFLLEPQTLTANDADHTWIAARSDPFAVDDDYE